MYYIRSDTHKQNGNFSITLHVHAQGYIEWKRTMRLAQCPTLIPDTWCFTVNNTEDNDLYDRLCADQRIQRLVIGDECGTAGNRHVQGYTEWKRTMRLAQCKTVIPSAHWEVARASAYDNYKYCSKDGMFTTHGDWEEILRKEGQGQEASLQMYDLIQKLLRDRRSHLKNHGLYIRHKFGTSLH